MVLNHPTNVFSDQSDKRSAVASAPGSIGNLGPGLDILGCAVTGLRDVVQATFTSRPGLHIDDSGHKELPIDATLHASGIAAAEVISRAIERGCHIDSGIALRLTKLLPLAGGQGGSAASAVAAAVAVNALLGNPLETAQLLLAAFSAESQVAGRHLDNVAPALHGGIVLVRNIDPPELVHLPVPSLLRIALVLPEQQLRTTAARAVLPRQVSRDVALAQAANVATIASALHRGDLELLGRAMIDRIAEPARAGLLPGFMQAKRAAVESGAFGCSISGAGPTSFAIAADDATADRVVQAMCQAYGDCGVHASGRVARVDACGATIESS